MLALESAMLASEGVWSNRNGSNKKGLTRSELTLF